MFSHFAGYACRFLSDKTEYENCYAHVSSGEAAPTLCASGTTPPQEFSWCELATGARRPEVSYRLTCASPGLVAPIHAHGTLPPREQCTVCSIITSDAVSLVGSIDTGDARFDVSFPMVVKNKGTQYQAFVTPTAVLTVMVWAHGTTDFQLRLQVEVQSPPSSPSPFTLHEHTGTTKH